MNKRLVWAVSLGLAVVVPVAVLGGAARATHSAPNTVQVQTALDSTGVAAQETNLGDLVADAVRAAGDADASLVAADEITQTTIPTGSVTPDRIVKALRYSDDPTDTVVVLTLTGAQLKQAVERSVSRVPQPFDGFLQVSGLHIHYDASRPAGQRSIQITMGGAPLQDAQTYKIATTHSLAEGSFGYFRLWTSSAIAQDTGTTIADALTQYLATHRTLNASTDNRITP